MIHSYGGGSADGERCNVEGGDVFCDQEKKRVREGTQERGRGGLFRVTTW